MNYINAEQFIDDICAKNHILQRICIELTYRCNERCKHCYVFDEKKSADEELTTDQYFKLFDELRRMETLHITFTGGDPSQRQDFTEILRGAVDRDFAVTIFTNGIGFSEKTLAEIIRIRPSSMHFSIYSGIPEEHDEITGVKGSFQKTLTTLKKVKDAGIWVTVKTPVMTPTLNGFCDIQKLCRELDIRSEVSYFICATNHGDTSPTKLRLGNVEKYKEVMRIAQKEQATKEFQPRDVHGAICGAGQLSLSVNPYGEVFPCNSFHYWLGNIKDIPISVIWNGEELRRLYQLKFEQLGNRCVKCQWHDDCVYCLGSALAENGDIFIPIDENCKIARANYEFRLERYHNNK
ncbi:MAG: radical SAM protein [Selenomonadaceae bacterium]|nr:radical SAM protein [Selenomonadaceae bacterium]